MYKLVFYVPETHKEDVKEACFAAGAGKYSGYDRCSWETLGLGQFRPLQGSSPTIGTTDVQELVPEYRVEMICQALHLKDIATALLGSHPYEEPAYEFYQIIMPGRGF